MKSWDDLTCMNVLSHTSWKVSLFSRIQTEYGEINHISPYSVQMRENMDQEISEYGHVSWSPSQYLIFHD